MNKFTLDNRIWDELKRAGARFGDTFGAAHTYCLDVLHTAQAMSIREAVSQCRADHPEWFEHAPHP